MKLKYLLPVATLASVATIVTPLVSCGDKDNNIIKMELTKNGEMSPLSNAVTIYYLTTEKSFTPDNEKTYEFHVDLSNYNWSGPVTQPDTKGMLAVPYGDYAERQYNYISSVSVQIGNDTLKEVDDPKNLNDKEFALDGNESGDDYILYRYDAINKETSMIFKLTIVTNHDESYPAFFPFTYS